MMRAKDLELDGGVAAFPGWSLVEITGRHRERFLGSQVTSDIAGLAVGDSQLSALLDRSGRLQAYFFIRKRADAIDLLLPHEINDHCRERLESHIVADDVTIERREVGTMRLVLGPAAVVTADQGSERDTFPVSGWGSRGFVTWSDRKISLPEVSSGEFDARRVLGGPPTWGREARPDQLINETALLDTAVSFDKGCYLGQETVAKVASHRGAVRAPVLLALSDSEVDPEKLVGESFSVGKRSRAGEVLSAAWWDDQAWLQVSLHRELRVISRELSCVFADGSTIDAVIRTVPLLCPPSRQEMADQLTVAASAAFAIDRSDRALELLERATTICPAWADGYESKGVILGRLGRHREAIEEMNRLLEVEPSSIMAHSNLSLFHNQLGDIEEAERHLALATRVSFGGESGTDPARLEQQESKERETDRNREEMFRQVLEIDPDDSLAHFGMGELAVERGRFSQAVDHLEKAIVSDPNHSAAIFALGSALEGLDDPERAREVYERGVEIAARKGDLATAQKMQERITGLASQMP